MNCQGNVLRLKKLAWGKKVIILKTTRWLIFEREQDAKGSPPPLSLCVPPPFVSMPVCMCLVVSVHVIEGVLIAVGVLTLDSEQTFCEWRRGKLWGVDSCASFLMLSPSKHWHSYVINVCCCRSCLGLECVKALTFTPHLQYLL